jgi:hypothetical protein
MACASCSLLCVPKDRLWLDYIHLAEPSGYKLMTFVRAINLHSGISCVNGRAFVPQYMLRRMRDLIGLNAFRIYTKTQWVATCHL